MNQVLGGERDHDAVLSRFVSGLSGRDARLLRELLDGDADSVNTDLTSTDLTNTSPAGDGQPG
jgi:hypothetical protein